MDWSDLVYLSTGSPVVDDDIPVLSALTPGTVTTAPVALGPILNLTPLVQGWSARIVSSVDLSVLAEPETVHGISWSDERRGPGSGSIVVQLDDPTYPPDARVWRNHLVQFRDDGVLTAASLIDRITERTMSPTGTRVAGAQQAATLQGLGVSAILDRARVQPAAGADYHGGRHRGSPKEQDRVFDWTSPQFDASTWTGAHQIMTVDAAHGGGWPHQPMGEDFTLTTGAYMVWSPQGTDLIAPVGQVPFIRDVEITSPGRHALEVIIDNLGWVRVDTQHLANVDVRDGFTRATFIVIDDLSAGWHRFAFYARNVGDGSNQGPGAVAFNLHKVDQQNKPTALVARSDSNTMMLDYPSQLPGWTLGQVMLLLLDEAWARGLLPTIEPDFTAQTDSAGRPWPIIRDGISTKTGTGYATFLDECVGKGLLDWWRVAPNGRTFSMFSTPPATGPVATLVPAPVENPRTGSVVELDRVLT